MLIALALLAAVLGSLLATTLYYGYGLLALDWSNVPLGDAERASLFPTAIAVSLPFTALGALSLGAPVTYALRGWISRQPIPASIGIAVIGATLGSLIAFAVIGGLDTPGVEIEPIVATGALYGAATAFSFAWVTYGWQSRRSGDKNVT